MERIYNSIDEKNFFYQNKIFLDLHGRTEESEFLKAYSGFTFGHPSTENIIFSYVDDHVVADNGVDRIHFPRPIPRVKMAMIALNYRKWLMRKYSCPGFAIVEAGDVVVDCGAFVGGFSLSCASFAKSIYVFEPSASNFSCVEKNLRNLKHVYPMKAGLGEHSGTAKLNISSSAVEHSFLDVDDGTIEGVEEVPVSRLEDLVSAGKIESIDFLKVEAEGFEVEVIRGLGDLRPPKIAIDVSAERGGESPQAEIVSLLQPLGYQFVRKRNVLFAIQKKAP